MATITFQQTVLNNQVIVSLFSTNLPSGTVNVNLGFSYTADHVTFDTVQFSGNSSSSVRGNVLGTTGTVTIDGSIVPSGSGAFATLAFNAIGLGSFNADITTLKINGVAAVFSDPAAISFDILPLVETIDVQSGQFTSGKFNLGSSFFSKTAVKLSAEHGTVSIAPFSSGAWTYTPDKGFYGLDKFTLTSGETGSTTDKQFIFNVNPVGTSDNDLLHSSGANYTLDAGAGIDTLAYTGARANFTIANASGKFTVVDNTGAEGTNTLTNVERLHFADANVALDTSGNAGKVYRVYQAAFDRVPDPVGLGFWINAMDKGASLVDISRGFMGSAEFATKYGANPSNLGLVTKIYENVLHRAPESSGLNYWIGVLDTHVDTSQGVLANISESAENQAQVIGAIQNGFSYTPYI